MEEDKISMKDIPSYHWPTKEEGKAQYPKFAKDFQGEGSPHRRRTWRH